MKKIFILFFIMSVGVVTTSCVNMFAVKELNDAAVDFMNKGDIQSAISRLESSVDLDGNSYETRYNLAVAYLKVDECEKSLENIDVALKLAKKEDASVYYTKAVALSCLADKLLYKTNEDGEREDVAFADEQSKIEAYDKYTSYLEDSSECYSKYLSLDPNASDYSQVQAQIESNQESIAKLHSENKVNE